jgi:hypothetical protein
MQRIIHPTDDGGVAVLIPGKGWDIAEAARKDVPAGVPYRIVDESDGIGAEAWFAEQEQEQ